MFQSTRPARGATCAVLFNGGGGGVSIHAPRAGRDSQKSKHKEHEHVSIHAPRAGRDLRSAARCAGTGVSIHAPRAGRDNGKPHPQRRRKVSIHAPRAGRDKDVDAVAPDKNGFNPRAPRGARHQSQGVAPQQDTFQSTRPARGATIFL